MFIAPVSLAVPSVINFFLTLFSWMGNQKYSSYVTLFPLLSFILGHQLLASMTEDKKNILRGPHIGESWKYFGTKESLQGSEKLLACSLGKDGFIFLWLRLFSLEWQCHFESNRPNKWYMPQDLSRVIMSQSWVTSISKLMLVSDLTLKTKRILYHQRKHEIKTEKPLYFLIILLV